LYSFCCIQAGGLGLQPLIWTNQILDKPIVQFCIAIAAPHLV